MPVQVKLARPRTRSSLGMNLLRLVLLVIIAALVVFGGVFLYYSHQYEGLVDQRLAQGPLFASTSQIYAAPQEVRPGQHLSAANIAAMLRRAGYNSGGANEMGSYQLRGDDAVLIKPGPQSYLAMDGATIATPNGVVATITAENGAPLAGYKLEPQLITALSEDKNRTKRRLVTYGQIPPRMVQAVLAIEDRRFFEHGGLNYIRTTKCAIQDMLAHRMNCGGSTITQQLARGFFLTPEKTYARKIAEIMITFQLERRFTKQQIFEMYANQINIGQRGSFAVNGFGEAAQSYFGKPLPQLDLAECALLAGMIQRPNYFSPYKHVDRARERRNLVLDSMVETGAITNAEAAHAKAEPIRLAQPDIDASEAPYFVDLVHDQLIQRLGDTDTARSGNLRIYTSLDPELQRAAAAAVASGMRQVDELIRKGRGKGSNGIMPQVALIALNPHTGQVLALVGGRDYAASQLDHATSKRPTGSIFKPFVYAEAERQAINGQALSGGQPFTALTILHDVPTTFTFDNGRQTYNPGNYLNEYHGDVTAIYALAHSLNNATISLGQQVGFDNVASLARQSGITGAKGTPSVSLGAYDATPLDMAGAYTVFANNGVHLNPWMLASVRNPQGDVVADFAPEARQVMDPKAAFLTQSLLEGVMNFGYGTAVRKLGFRAPAAGKTGSSHDAWFAAYSSNLLCIVWVGNDDYTDVKLTGALAAAPIWAEFMNRAIRLPQYSDMKPFPAPEGIQIVAINRASNLPADESCPGDSFNAAFLTGTVPQSTCSRMGEDAASLGSKLFNPDGSVPNSSDADDPERHHRNVFQKMFGLGKNKDKPKDQDEQP